ncbi:hypothetical protein Tco_0936975, partial [Tanacetum coccineum]
VEPRDGPYCQGCALLRKKFKEDLFTYCVENEFFEDLQDTSESSDDNTWLLMLPQSMRCVFVGKVPHYGYNCPLRVPIISNPEPCKNQTIDEPLQNLQSLQQQCLLRTCQQCGCNEYNGVCFYCTIGNGTPSNFSTPYSSNDSPSVANHPPQSQYVPYSCELCGNDSHYGYDCPPQVPSVYNQDPCFNQNFDYFPQTSLSFPQQYPCCENYGGPHETYQCQPMNEDYYHEQNSCYDYNSFGFDQFQPPQYTVNHPIFDSQNGLLNSSNKLMEQMTTLCDLYGRTRILDTIQKRIDEVNNVLVLRTLSSIPNCCQFWTIDNSSSDDDSPYGENIDYVDASPPDVEIVSLEVVEIVDPEVGRIDDDILLTIKDDILHEKLLNINLLIAKIDALRDNPTPSSDVDFQDCEDSRVRSIHMSFTSSASFWESSVKETRRSLTSVLDFVVDSSTMIVLLHSEIIIPSMSELVERISKKKTKNEAKTTKPTRKEKPGNRQVKVQPQPKVNPSQPRLGSTSGIRAFSLRNFDLEVMEFESAHSNTTAKLPILKLVTKMSVPVSAKEKINKKNDVKARSLLLMALPNEHQLTFSQYNDAKTMFAAIETRFGDNEATKKTQKTLLKLQKINTYVVVWMNKAEIETMSIHDLYNKFKIIEQSVKKSVGASSGAQNLAFMTAPSTSSTNDVNTAKPAYEVSTVSPNVNTASSQVSTASFSDNVLYAFMVENPNGSNLLQQDLEQIYEDDQEAIDLKWQLSPKYEGKKMGHFARECRAPRNKEGQFRYQDKTRKQGNNEDTSSKVMLAIDGVGFNWSDMAEE